MPTKIENIHVNRNTDFTGEYALGWEHGGFRFHVWVSADGTRAVRPPLMKNPPPGVKHREPGDFPTRKLDVAIAKNKAMIDAAMTWAVAGKMFEAADQKLADAEKERLAEAAAAHKIALAKEAGPKMLRVLRAIAEFWNGEQPNFPLAPGAMIFNDSDELIADAVREAVAAAEGRQ